jgi:hypothetical protein
VIRPGEPVLDIVPDDEELLVDARLSPMDIDVGTRPFRCVRSIRPPTSLVQP